MQHKLCCRICANHPESGWLAEKFAQNHPVENWIVRNVLRHKREEHLFEGLLEKKNDTMQNNLKNQTAYACWPTNENSLAAFLVDRNDYRFFNREILEKPSQLFSHSSAIDATNPFLVDRFIYHHLDCFSWRKWEKIKVIVRGRSEQAFCNRPEPKLFLQKNECMIQWIGWKAVTRIVAKYIFRKYNSFTQALKLLDMQKKKGFWTVWKFLAFEMIRKRGGEKKVSSS